MLYLIIFTLLIILSAAFKAVSDTLVHHYDTSIFVRFNAQFFDPAISSLNKYKNRDPAQGKKKYCFTPISDAWHLSNSAMIFCFLALPFFVPDIINVWLSNLLNQGVIFKSFALSNIIYPLVGYALVGILNILSFNTFYNHILKIKK